MHPKLLVSKEALKGRPPTGWDVLPPYWLDSDGLVMGLRVGEKIPLRALLHGLMLTSSNDAANVVAENLGGTIPEFMDQLNAYLKSIGCKNTRLSNPHGLTHPEHWTSAYDLAIITKKALKNPMFRKLVTTLEYEKPKTNKQPKSTLKMQNYLVLPKSRYYYPMAIGVKTGYTELAGFNLVAAAEKEGRTLIAVVLGYEDKQERFEAVRMLFEKAFNEKKAKRRLAGPETIFTKQVLGAKRPVKASLVMPLYIEYYPSEEPACKAALHWTVSQLPISKGQKLGEIHILSEDGRFLEKGDLVSQEDVKGTLFFALQQLVMDLFR